MTTAKFTSDSYTPEEIHAGDYPIATTNGTAGAAIVKHAIVGRVTTGGKIIPSDPTATDGSQVPLGIAAYAAAADDDPITYFSSGGFDQNEIELGDWTAAALKVAFDRTPVFIIDPGAI